MNAARTSRRGAAADTPEERGAAEDVADMPEHGDACEDLARRSRLILRHEEAFARALAGRVIRGPEVSVWMVLVPLLLVHHAHRVEQVRAARAAFEAGVLRNRKLALQAAREALAAAKAADPVRAASDPSGSGAPSRTDPALAEASLAEASLLQGHYALLLSQQGAGYAELVRKAYGSAAAYGSFLDRLAQAEAELHRAALEQRAGDVAEQDVVRGMQEAARAFRLKEVRRIFGEPSRP